MTTIAVPANVLDPDPEFVLGDPVAEAPASVGHERARKRSAAPIVALVFLAVVAGGAAFYFLRSGVNAPASAPPVVRAPAVEQPEPAIRHPVENITGVSDAAPAQPQLPPLDDSDALAKTAIATILNGDTWLSLLIPDGFIRHIVATVDGLPHETIAVQVLPTRRVAGLLATTTGARGTAIAADNGARYSAYVSAVEAIDTARMAGFYVRLYPLLQQAYVELGYPKGYFNDRVITVIDHLLVAPEPPPPLYLTQSKVLYEFADPDLEGRSAGQKMMVRIGLDNERRVKAKLRDIRKALATESPPR